VAKSPAEPPSKVDKLLPQLTREELEKLRRHVLIEETVEATTPERRRQLLSKMEVCPCCDRWLGHNKPTTAVRPIGGKRRSISIVSAASGDLRNCGRG
jgi:hypothetical protein